LFVVLGVRNVRVGIDRSVGDPVDESVSERSDSVGYECGGVDGGVDGGISVRIEPWGSRCAVMAGAVLRGGNPSVALLFASCLVNKGVGVDGVRDSLTVSALRCDVGVKKKVKGCRVRRASLNRRDGQDNIIFVARSKDRCKVE
jgi:hypothetical protein